MTEAMSRLRLAAEIYRRYHTEAAELGLVLALRAYRKAEQSSRR